MYTWNSKKLHRKVHMIGENGLTLCKAENGGVILDKEGNSVPPHRKLCGVCAFRSGRIRPKKKIQTRAKKKRPERKTDNFLKSREWKEIRYRALKAANGRCQCCGASPDDGAVLHVDHIKSRIKHPELALNLENLQVLCASCNMGKGWEDETDWREPRLATLMGERIDTT